eukprot:TRINITY_DN10971_c0_g1_i4.p2 TRINITY_DN10971_c0_g1~~TRINITY_DN10971_c0_g1_i4.p2  ORF type:complete len:111 (-),score=35.92 TRINITY_DN10971_c0_g1_i4:105-437(-)
MRIGNAPTTTTTASGGGVTCGDRRREGGDTITMGIEGGGWRYVREMMIGITDDLCNSVNTIIFINTIAAPNNRGMDSRHYSCLLYTSDAADEEDSVDLGGRRIIKKKKNI